MPGWRFWGRVLCEVAVSGEFDTNFEQFRRGCADLASQAHCPRHFKKAAVEMAGDNFDDLSVEVVACCEDFRKRVEDALNKLVTNRV